jgi:uncharacterized membrane protein
MISSKNIPENEESWLTEELVSPMPTDSAGSIHSRSTNSQLIVPKRIGNLMGRTALFVLVLAYSELFNLWFYTVTYLDLLGLVTDPFAVWVSILTQPWICLGPWVTRHLGLPSPYSSVQASLITGIVSALLLSICLQLVVRRFPRLLRASVILFVFLTVSTGVSYALDSYRLNVYLSTPHDGGP